MAKCKVTWQRWATSNNTATTASITCSDSAAPWYRWNYVWEIGTEPAKPITIAPRERSARIAADLEVRRRREEREARNARLVAEEQARAVAAAAAGARAEKLLRSALTADQRQCLEARGFFYTMGADGHMYRIKRGRCNNVERVDVAQPSRPPVERLCAHPGLFVPDADTMLAQKLMLECDPAAFRKIANKTPLVAGV